MKIKLLVAALALQLGSFGVHAVDADAAFGTLSNGKWVGTHWTRLAPQEQGPSSSAFLSGQAYFDDVNCPSQYRSLIYHGEGIQWYWYTCPGSNRGFGEHGAVLNGQRFELGGTAIYRIF